MHLLFLGEALLLVSSWAAVAQARTFWSSVPASFGPQDSDDWILKTGYPLGNGRLGGTQFLSIYITLLVSLLCA